MNENNNWFTESMQSQLHDLYNNSFIYYYNEFKPQLELSGSVKSNPTTPQNIIKNSWDTTEKT